MCFIGIPKGPYVLHWHSQGALCALLTLPGGPMCFIDTPGGALCASLTLPGGPLCWGFPDLKIEKFVGFTRFPFHVFDRYEIHIDVLGDFI